MATWRRCLKSPYYKRVTRDGRFDKRAEAFDAAYVDPVDLILVRTLPWHFDDPRERSVTVLKWRILSVDEAVYLEGLSDEQAVLMEFWAERVTEAMGGGMSREKKAILLEDLEVDLHERDLLLDAIENFVNMAPPEDTRMDHRKVPATREAVDGLLFHFGVGIC